MEAFRRRIFSCNSCNVARNRFYVRLAIVFTAVVWLAIVCRLAWLETAFTVLSRLLFTAACLLVEDTFRLTSAQSQLLHDRWVVAMRTFFFYNSVEFEEMKVPERF